MGVFIGSVKVKVGPKMTESCLVAVGTSQLLVVFGKTF